MYTHKKAKAIEFMVVDALLAADPALRITRSIRHPADFQLLDDNLIDVRADRTAGFAAAPVAAGGAAGCRLGAATSPAWLLWRCALAWAKRSSRAESTTCRNPMSVRLACTREGGAACIAAHPAPQCPPRWLPLLCRR